MRERQIPRRRRDGERVNGTEREKVQEEKGGGEGMRGGMERKQRASGP